MVTEYGMDSWAKRLVVAWLWDSEARALRLMIGALQKWRQDLRTVTTGWLWHEADIGG